MIKAIWFAFFLIAITTISPGCFSQVDKPILTYQRDSNRVPPMSAVGKQGLYALFPGNGSRPLDAAFAYLYPGDTFGFESDEGKVCGVYTRAGESKKIPLDGVLTTDYVWKYEGDKQP